MDLFEKLNIERTPLGKYANRLHEYIAFPKLTGELGPHMYFKGKKMLNWSLNNYLGLANHPEVRKIDAEAAAKWGMAYPMGARMMSGNTDMHDLLEARLSSFVKKPDTVLLNYGYQGIISAIDSLLDRKDVVVYDEQSHACIIDALRMHLGKRYVFKHNDIESCEKQLQRATKMAQESGGGILVITEGVFGMSGVMGNLKEIIALKQKYNFRLLVDDAHGFGTMGKTGAGTGEEQGVQEGIDVYFSTFAKSMATIGAFVSSTKEVCMYLRYNMRSQIFAKSLPMPIVEGALKRLELLQTCPELREKLWQITHALQNGLRERGFNIGKTQSPVTPVFLNGTDGEAAQLVFDLRENYHIFCSVVVYPVVPKDVIMLRIIPTAAHSLEDVQRTLDAFSEIAQKLKTGYYNPEVPVMTQA
ncbi:MAG: pyridoxal phosphate-dependent aminotransferase family protein [Microscillaceae bacterium]|nr:pyridoxal phosphate-dependent aminotransferase family protein [Microscillaceae bacterium]MDW8345367.1 pyridoxal phosphate-dependent aminotransferase family protein [Bacteroidia bacterium]MDW8460254.1 pyridoxal phosphate-dependent aminotransferase family protein [Cytophagales bacterium]